ncbi:MAG TPA: universal stress protein [Steroidobacteraceae bacterium]|jgi:nucleotide-binding universal stress UspA family protein|nr:universal stress protein [Steroidobacteraceae bacterium]
MASLNTILAATDFSDDGLNAARRAASLAAEHGARLQLLHVLRADALDELRDRLRLPVDVRENLVEDAQRRLNSLADEIGAAAGSRPECVLRTGNVLDELVAAADHSDLLVLGAHGLRRPRDLLVGTTAERLLLRGRRPMLVVRGDAQLRYRKVLVPVDFSLHSMATLRCARQIAPTAHLQVFHAYENPYEGKLWYAGVEQDVIEKFRLEARNQALENLGNLLEKGLPGDAEVSTSIEHGEAKLLIAAEAAKQGADLIVIGKHGRTPLGEFFLGGATRATVARASCDVLVVPDHPRL